MVALISHHRHFSNAKAGYCFTVSKRRKPIISSQTRLTFREGKVEKLSLCCHFMKFALPLVWFCFFFFFVGSFPMRIPFRQLKPLNFLDSWFLWMSEQTKSHLPFGHWTYDNTQAIRRHLLSFRYTGN